MSVVVFPQPPFWLMMAMIRMANLPWRKSAANPSAAERLVSNPGPNSRRIAVRRVAGGPLPSVEIDDGAWKTLELWDMGGISAVRSALKWSRPDGSLGSIAGP